MNKKLLLSILGLMLSITNITFSNYYIKNNSAWNIKYRLVNDTKEKEFYPQEIITVGDGIQIEIRRSGTASSYVTSWYIVPKPYDLARESLDMHKFHEFDLAIRNQGKKPFVLIGSNWTGGWSFTVETSK